MSADFFSQNAQIVSVIREKKSAPIRGNFFFLIPQGQLERPLPEFHLFRVVRVTLRLPNGIGSPESPFYLFVDCIPSIDDEVIVECRSVAIIAIIDNISIFS